MSVCIYVWIYVLLPVSLHLWLYLCLYYVFTTGKSIIFVFATITMINSALCSLTDVTLHFVTITTIIIVAVITILLRYYY